MVNISLNLKNAEKVAALPKDLPKRSSCKEVTKLALFCHERFCLKRLSDVMIQISKGCSNVRDIFLLQRNLNGVYEIPYHSFVLDHFIS